MKIREEISVYHINDIESGTMFKFTHNDKPSSIYMKVSKELEDIFKINCVDLKTGRLCFINNTEYIIPFLSHECVILREE